jgi:hypothetical protein
MVSSGFGLRRQGSERRSHVVNRAPFMPWGDVYVADYAVLADGKGSTNPGSVGLEYAELIGNPTVRPEIT